MKATKVYSTSEYIKRKRKRTHEAKNPVKNDYNSLWAAICNDVKQLNN